MRVRQLIAPSLAVLALTGASSATASSGGAGVTGSSAHSTAAHPEISGRTAKIIHGVGYAPSLAPMAVKKAIWAGNKIRKKPYVWGGGHGSFNDRGYDCSGSVSYVMHAAGLLSSPLDSTGFESWGDPGTGQWITVYANAGHAYAIIAGLRFDTSGDSSGETGPRWHKDVRSASGYTIRHPAGF